MDSTTDKYISPQSKMFRYYDDFDIGTPPSQEDGGFLHIGYNGSQKPRVSTFDRINQELGITLEEKLPTSPLTQAGPETDPSTPCTPFGVTLALGDKKFVLQSSSTEPKPSKIDVNSRPKDIPPLIVLPIKILGTRNKEDSKAEENLPSPELSTSPRRNLNIVDKLHMLSNSNLPETPYTTPNSTPFVTPLNTPQSSPKPIRKIIGGTGVVMEKSTTVNNYFYKGTFFGASATNSGDMLDKSPLDSNQTTSYKSDSSINQNFGLDPKQLARKRRPKPSNLREMNFWAPTSM